MTALVPLDGSGPPPAGAFDDVSYTPRLGLAMPGYLNLALVEQLNSNMVTLDRALLVDEITGEVASGLTLTDAILITPSIDDFSQALHDHLDDAGGGALPGYVPISHLADEDPHAQYLRQEEADLLYLPAGYVPPPVPPEYVTETELATALGPYATDADLASHAGAPNPHAQYTTDAEVATAISAHVALPDPHPVYLRQSEADPLYLPQSWAPQHLADTDPHPTYLTQVDADGRYVVAPLPPPVDAYTKSESDLRYPLKTDPDPYSQYLTTQRGDLRYQQSGEKGQPGGYAPVDPSGLIPTQYLPPLAITDTFVANSEAEMVALDAQRGDLCIRADLGGTYVLATEPASEADNWVLLVGAGGTSPVMSVNGQVGVVDLGAEDVDALPETYTPPVSPDSGNAIVWRANGLYAPPGGATGDFLPLEGGTLTGSVLVTDPVSNPGFETAVHAGMISISSPPGGLWAELSPGSLGLNGDGVYGQLTVLPTGGLSLYGGPLVPSSPNTQDLGSSTARWRKLWAQDADVTGAYNVAQTNTGNLAMTVRLGAEANPRWRVRTDGAVGWGPGGATAEDTYAYRLGVGQLRIDSYLAVGVNHSAWGSTIRALQVGSSGSLHSGSTATLGTTVLANNTYIDGGGDKAQYTGTAARLVLGLAGGAQLQTAASATQAAAQTWTARLTVSNLGLTTLAPAAGDALSAGGGVMPGTTNAYDLGATALSWRKLWAVDIESTNVPTVGGTSMDTRYSLAGHNHASLYVPIDGSVRMQGNLLPLNGDNYDLGSTSYRWRNLLGMRAELDKYLLVGAATLPGWDSTNFKVVHLGRSSSVMGYPSNEQVQLRSNAYIDLGWVERAVAANGAGILALNANTLVYSNAPSVGAGATLTLTPRLTVTSSGQVQLAPNAGTAAISIGGTAQPKISVQSGAPSSPMTGDLWVW